MRLAVIAALVLTASAPARPSGAIDARGFLTLAHPIARSTDGAIDVWRMRRAGSTDHDFDLVSVVLPQSAYATAILPVRRADFAAVLLRPDLCRNAAVVTNGGFFFHSGTTSRPLGLVRAAGRTLSRASGRRYGGFLVANAGRLAILRRSDAKTALAAQDGIESSPIIVWQGRSDMTSDDGIRFDRVAIGSTADGRAVVVGAFGSDQDTVSLSELGTLAMAAVRAQGARLDTLLALDGGPSAHIYLAAQRRLFGFAGSIYLPNAVCIGRR